MIQDQSRQQTSRPAYIATYFSRFGQAASRLSGPGACLEQPASAAGVISRVEARGDRRQGAYLGQDHMGQDRPRGQRYLSPTAPGDGAAPLHSAVRCRSAGNRTSLNTAGCAILRMTKAVGKCPRTWKNCCGFRISPRAPGHRDGRVVDWGCRSVPPRRS